MTAPASRMTLAAAALAAVALLGGCKQAAAQTPPKLLVWINGDKAYNGLQKVGDAFERESGVKVVVEHPVDAPEKYTQAAGAGKGPDVFCWPHDRVGEWAKAGLLTPVQPRKALFDEVEATAWQAFRYQGRYWGYPIAIETTGLIYNKALVAQAPATWDALIALDKTLRQRGKHAILWDYNKSFFTWPMFAGAGGVIFGRDAQGDFDAGQVAVNNEGALAAGRMLERLIQEGVMPRGARYSEMESSFARGEIAMMISGPWAWENARKAGIDIGVAPIPAVIPGKPSKPFVGVLGCMISAPSKNKDLAREFIFYQALSVNPLIRASMENARAGEAIPNIPEVGRFWTAMDAALEAITNGLQSPKDALDGASGRMLLKQ